MNRRDESDEALLPVRQRGRPRMAFRDGMRENPLPPVPSVQPIPDVAPLPKPLTHVKYLEDKVAESTNNKGFLPEPQVTYVEFSNPPFIVKYKNTFRNICLLSMFIFVLLLLNTTV